MSTDPTQPVPSPAPRSQEPPTQPTPRWQPPPPPPPKAQPDQPAPAPPTARFPSPPARDAQPPARNPHPAVRDPLMPTMWRQEIPRQLRDQQPPAAAPPRKAAPRPRRGPRRRVRRSVMAAFTVIVIVILLVIGDRVAAAITENDIASQFTSNGFPVKPAVSIEGFPFLTQLAAKDFNTVDISASSVPAGPVTISSLKATVTGMHFSGYTSSANAKVDHLTATAFISLGALADAGGLGGGSGITMTPDGSNKLKISANLGGIVSDTEEAQITQTGPQTINFKILPGSSPISGLLSSFASFSFTLPKGVPASLRITGLTLNSQGLTVSAAASNAVLSQ